MVLVMVQIEVKVVLVIEVLVMVVKRKKGAYSSSWETQLRAHLPCGLTMLPVTLYTLTPARQAGTRFTYSGVIEG